MTRKSLAAAAVLSTALGAYWLVPSGASYPLPPGELQAVTVANGIAVVDLPFAAAGEQYLLVVSNLSADVTPRRIWLESQRAERVEQVPLRRVAERNTGAIADATAGSAVRSVGTTEPADHVLRSTPSPGGGNASGSIERTFWLNLDGGGDNPAAFRPIAAVLAGEGRAVRVFVDRDDEAAADLVPATIALFDAVVEPRYAQRIGLAPDVDGDGKLAIVLTGWLGRMQGGTVSVGGLVQPRDFDRSLAEPLSNRADLLFLNSDTRPGGHLQNLLAHEYAHAVLSGTRNAGGGDAVYEEAWLDEAIAHQAEGLCGAGWSNLDYRLAAFLAAPQQAPLTVADYQREGLWRAPSPRGHTFLFLRWCGERCGPGLLPALIASRHAGRKNVAAATGEPFDELFRRFSADLLLRELSPCESSTDDAHVPTSTDAPPLSLTEPLGVWPLAGPRRELWELPSSGDVREAAVSGTSSAYYLLTATDEGPRRLTARIESGGELQVSLTRLPDDLPRLGVRVVGTAGRRSLEIVERGGGPATIEQVAWGPMAFATRGASMHVGVRGPALASLLGEARLTQRGRLASHRIDFAALPPGEVYVSVVARDEAGRRVTAWTSFDPSAIEPPLAAVNRDATSG